MTRYLILLSFLLFPLFAHAQGQEANAIPELDEESCRQLVTHQASADTEYKPGVDVSGKPVVEADLNPSVIDVPTELAFDLAIDAQDYSTGIDTGGGTQALMSIGQIEVAKDGSVTFNDKPLDGEAEASLRALCAEKQSKIKEPDEKVDLLKQ